MLNLLCLYEIWLRRCPNFKCIGWSVRNFVVCSVGLHATKFWNVIKSALMSIRPGPKVSVKMCSYTYTMKAPNCRLLQHEWNQATLLALLECKQRHKHVLSERQKKLLFAENERL